MFNSMETELMFAQTIKEAGNSLPAPALKTLPCAGCVPRCVRQVSGGRGEGNLLPFVFAAF